MLSAEAIAPNHPAHTLYEQRYERIRTALSPYLRGLSVEPIDDANPTAIDRSALLVAVIDGLQVQWL